MIKASPANDTVLVQSLNRNAYRKARKHVRESCGQLAELAVGEIIANALEHGKEGDLCISVRPRRVIVVVSNEVKVTRSWSRKPMEMGGRGLRIVQYLAAIGAIRRYDCSIQGSKHTTRLVLDRSLAESADFDLVPLDLEMAVS